MRNELLKILGSENTTGMLITHYVEEAIHLTDRVIVLSPRPTCIQPAFDVKLPHHCKLTSPGVQHLRTEIHKEFGV